MRSFLIIQIVFLCLPGMAGGQTPTDHSAEKDNGTVFLMRATGFTGSAVAFNIFVDDILACRQMNNTYSAHLIAPGKHDFSVQFSGKKSKEKAERLKLNIEAGKKYYIHLTFEGGAFVNKVYCQELTENSALQMFKRLKPSLSCN